MPTKLSYFVIPAKAEIYIYRKSRDSCLRRNDKGALVE